uniref:Putative chemosensory protein 24 n=1 Tax=Conopomorpha sinensis TaxID=940481 RepID=A0A649ZUQ5_9NEOP|nr:putative chemosensory protein 24 [Conopomorpha sinensis]
MRSLIFLAFVVVGVTCDSSQYNSKYDDFDAQEVVSNMRLLKSYAKCMLDDGPCTSAGKDFKRVLPEALSTECVKCSPKQRQLIRQVVRAIQERLPEDWDLLVKKYNPEGKFDVTFGNFLKSEN